MSTHMSLDCDGFAAALADYLEGDAPIAVRSAVESHVAECAACRQLLQDLDTIRHDAAALPALVPSRDLWNDIADRIDAKVVPIATRERTIVTTRRSWARPAIAAAALVVVTAGITHLATKATMTRTAPIAQSTASGVGTVAQQNGSAPQIVAASGPVSKGTGGEMTSSQTERPSSPNRTRPATAGSPVARLASAEPLMRETEPVYDREILKLRSIVKTRRSQLDPKTVAVLEQSIAVIDSAIAQSRAALANDPASGFLATQLNHSLEKKVELLRTAALLPART
jgi:putative zinc finger protein